MIDYIISTICTLLLFAGGYLIGSGFIEDLLRKVFRVERK